MGFFLRRHRIGIAYGLGKDDFAAFADQVLHRLHGLVPVGHSFRQNDVEIQLILYLFKGIRVGLVPGSVRLLPVQKDTDLCLFLRNVAIR